MPLFGFSDITFNKGTASTRGPLSSLVGSKYETNTLRYPKDLGNWDKSHYLVFYIRKQNKTSSDYKYGEGSQSDLDGTISATKAASILSGGAYYENMTSNFGNEIISKISSGLTSISGVTGINFFSSTTSMGNVFGDTTGIINGSGSETQKIIDESVKKITGGSLGFLKTTTLTTDAIALYMPDTLNYTYTQNYENANLGGELGGRVAGIAKSAIEEFKQTGAVQMENLKDVTKKTATLEAQRKISEIVGGIAGQNAGRLGFTAITGTVTNPMLELIYSSPNFRTFLFEFKFFPRDEKEAYEVQKILERFRFHQAPEIAGSGVAPGFGDEEVLGYLVPPSEFDIRFYYGGAQNPNIPPIATCVLTNIDVNYAPNGWSAYEVHGENSPALGRTGMPTAIELTLQFQETTYLTKSDFKSDLAIGGR